MISTPFVVPQMPKFVIATQDSINLCHYFATDVFALRQGSMGSPELPVLSSHPGQVLSGFQGFDPTCPQNFSAENVHPAGKFPGHAGSCPLNPRSTCPGFPISQGQIRGSILR